MTTNLNEYKTLKQLKLIAEDLTEINKRLTACIESLKQYSKYIIVMESISVLHNSRTLGEINLNKYNRLVENKNEE